MVHDRPIDKNIFCPQKESEKTKVFYSMIHIYIYLSTVRISGVIEHHECSPLACFCQGSYFIFGNTFADCSIRYKVRVPQKLHSHDENKKICRCTNLHEICLPCAKVNLLSVHPFFSNQHILGVWGLGVGYFGNIFKGQDSHLSCNSTM